MKSTLPRITNASASARFVRQWRCSTAPFSCDSPGWILVEVAS
jgi:hypothetical protein